MDNLTITINGITLGMPLIKNGDRVKYFAQAHNPHFELVKVISQPPEVPGQPRQAEIELRGRRFYVEFKKLEVCV